MTDAQKLAPCRADLRAKVLAVLAEMRAIGKPMKVTDAYRSPAEQARLYAIGRRGVPGERIVTTLRFGRHNQGRACDCAFLTPAGGVTWEGDWNEYGRRAKRRGLTWGGAWKRFVDRPHVEI